ncbi:MAG: flagellar motor switch protein FliN [Phycisphaerae bacterium]|nr:flagellar motor switch protein FliN [Phycisphaerae bacterium]
MAAAIVAESVGQTSGETAETAEPKGPALIGGAVNHISTDGAATFDLPPLDVPGAGQLSAMDLLDDVELNVKIELGRTEMYIEDVLQLGMGSVVELDKLAGDPVDIFVNEQLIARGEVLVLNDSFCVRINDILTPVPETEA